MDYKKLFGEVALVDFAAGEERVKLDCGALRSRQAIR